MSTEDLSASKMEESNSPFHTSSTSPSSHTATTAPTSPIPSENENTATPSASASPEQAITTANVAFNLEDYECMLCLRLLYEPTTLKCGHSFCRTCVEELYQQNHAKCPTCRQVLPIVHHYSSEKMSIAPSFTLCKFLEAAFPSQYAERRNEIMEMYPSRVLLEKVDENSAIAGSGDSGTTANPPTTPLPLFYLDPMVPRQVMQLNIFEHRYLLMISRCLEGSRHFGMVGFMSRRMIGERRRRRMRQEESMSNSASATNAAAPATTANNNNSNRNHTDHEDEEDDDDALSMTYGVEVEIVESSPQATGTMHIQVKAKRRFKIVGDTWRQDGYTMANVHWLALPQACTNMPPAETEYQEEETPDTSTGENEFPEGEALSSNAPLSSESETAQSPSPAETDPSSENDANNASQDTNARVIQLAQTLGPLVEEWKALVVAEGWQRYHGQLAQTINTIGPMPEANDVRGAVDRALWITALINPLPGMGVAPEIRPDVLETAAAADGNYVPLLLVVTHGMRKSIEYLTPNAVVVWMHYQLQKLYYLLIGRGTRRLGPSPPLPGTHQMINALLRLLVVSLVLGFFWQRILTPKTTSTLSSPAEVAFTARTASPSMDSQTGLEL